MNPVLASGLYFGRLMHARFAPRPHQFQYRVFMAYLDLDELPALCARSWAWSCTHFAPFWFRRQDYFGAVQVPLKQAVYDAVEAELGVRPSGPVRLLTNPRCFGVRMNPISVYYVFDASAERVEFVVAEVTNTPWDQKVVYVLDYRHRRVDAEVQFQKQLHVSPFMPMQQSYRWQTHLPGEHLRIRLQNVATGGERQREEASPAAAGSCRKVFEALLTLERREADARELSALVWRFPLMTVKVIAGIYWQAFRLWRKGAHFYSHPGAEPDDRLPNNK